jgi:hypothetical protein
VTCVTKINRFDRIILAGRDPEEPVCRLLVERLKWASLIGLMFAVLMFGLTVFFAQRSSHYARQQLARDCVDRTGDVAFRNVLAELVMLNERRPPEPEEQRRATAAILRRGLIAAGDLPACIANDLP